MFIFKKTNGALEVAPANFSPDNYDAEMLAQVEEVLCINKVLVKQTRLVPKNPEARAKIRETQLQAEAEEKPRRNKKGK